MEAVAWYAKDFMKFLGWYLLRLLGFVFVLFYGLARAWWIIILFLVLLWLLSA
jgi:hypothetical protein